MEDEKVKCEPPSQADHWGGVFSDLFSILVTSSTVLQGASPHPTGANVQLCCKDGRVAVHSTTLRKFTVLLDMLDDATDYTDPWGTLTLVLPDLNTGVVHALCQLMYCGDSGSMTGEEMNDIMNIIRPEFGGSSLGCSSVDESNDVSQLVRVESPVPAAADVVTDVVAAAVVESGIELEQSDATEQVASFVNTLEIMAEAVTATTAEASFVDVNQDTSMVMEQEGDIDASTGGAPDDEIQEIRIESAVSLSPDAGSGASVATITKGATVPVTRKAPPKKRQRKQSLEAKRDNPQSMPVKRANRKARPSNLAEDYLDQQQQTTNGIKDVRVKLSDITVNMPPNITINGLKKQPPPKRARAKRTPKNIDIKTDTNAQVKGDDDMKPKSNQLNLFDCQCSFKCGQKFTLAQRVRFNMEFQKKSYDQKKAWTSSLCWKDMDPKSSTHQQMMCHFPNDDSSAKVRVCKKFFFGTLGLQGKSKGPSADSKDSPVVVTASQLSEESPLNRTRRSRSSGAVTPNYSSTPINPLAKKVNGNRRSTGNKENSMVNVTNLDPKVDRLVQKHVESYKPGIAEGSDNIRYIYQEGLTLPMMVEAFNKKHLGAHVSLMSYFTSMKKMRVQVYSGTRKRRLSMGRPVVPPGKKMCPDSTTTLNSQEIKDLIKKDIASYNPAPLKKGGTPGVKYIFNQMISDMRDRFNKRHSISIPHKTYLEVMMSMNVGLKNVRNKKYEQLPSLATKKSETAATAAANSQNIKDLIEKDIESYKPTKLKDGGANPDSRYIIKKDAASPQVAINVMRQRFNKTHQKNVPHKVYSDVLKSMDVVIKTSSFLQQKYPNLNITIA